MSTSNPVPKIYKAVIDDVIKKVKESFLNEGVDEQVLNELKQLWENKLIQSRAIDFIPSDVNVRVSLTYPHNMPSLQGINQQAGSSSKQMTTNPTKMLPSSPFVYVSNHATLGNVGQMSGAAAQAAMAIQNMPARIPQQQHVIQQPHIIHVRGHPPNQQMYPAFAPGGLPSGARVIYTPQQTQSSTSQSSAEPKQHIIQVDGTSDNREESTITQNRVESTINQNEVESTIPNNNEPTTKQTGKHRKSRPAEIILQLDGADSDTSEDELDEDEDFDNYPIAPVAGEGEQADQEEEDEPLNSEDDVSDDDPTDLFDTDNVVVCQYDKIARTRNRWKFHLKDGIMNLRSKDYVFHKANGDSEW